MFITSLCVCTPLLMDIVEKWRSTPIVTMADGHTTLVTDIPFPAVTICPKVKTNVSEFSWYTQLTSLENPPQFTSNLK